jgi:hypothetical protein
MNAQDVLLGDHRAFEQIGPERDAREVAAMALLAALAQQVDDHRAHDPARVREETRAIGKGDVAALGEPDERFVHQRRGVQHDVATAPAQAGARELAQLGVARREPLLQIGRPALA